ncbi:MAG TPA: 2-oxoacid:acceptor oxidoreductase family protein [Candidatus Dormibacteraeota bacterium]|nr:2-oxoacid:acceptor oxidoreductase family protein [Candidatus Dormibacteraeota bacterium]
MTTGAFQVRIHGRGGQGVVTAAELLSVAAFIDGRYAQAFPSFGSERTGAPVVSFCRISDRPIQSREPIANPDALIVQDPTLLHLSDLLAGLDADGYLLVNSPRPPAELPLGALGHDLDPNRVQSVPATEMALQRVGRPVPNTVLLGGFAALTRQVSLESVLEAIRQRFPGAMGEANVIAATDAHDFVSSHLEAFVGAPAD